MSRPVTYCTVAGCDRKHKARGLCANHYQARKRLTGDHMKPNKDCDHCGKPFYQAPSAAKKNKHGFCSRACKNRFYGPPEGWPFCLPQKKGAENPAWRGGTINVSGYRAIRMPDHPRATKNGYLEHRLVMEQFLGRALERHEEVHHINGDKLDNRPENLVVMDSRKHRKAHDDIWRELLRLTKENQELRAQLAPAGAVLPLI